MNKTRRRNKKLFREFNTRPRQGSSACNVALFDNYDRKYKVYNLLRALLEKPSGAKAVAGQSVSHRMCVLMSTATKGFHTEPSSVSAPEAAQGGGPSQPELALALASRRWVVFPGRGALACCL